MIRKWKLAELLLLPQGCILAQGVNLLLRFKLEIVFEPMFFEVCTALREVSVMKYKYFKSSHSGSALSGSMCLQDPN